MIAIVNYGLSNLLSIQRAVGKYNKDTFITSDPKELCRADKIILPGVGAFRYGMDQLKKYGLASEICRMAQEGTPVLGICLGMQMLFEDSDEGGVTEGLGLIEGHVILIPNTTADGGVQDRPHIGWEQIVRHATCEDRFDILAGIESTDEVYFVHSYEGKPKQEQDMRAYFEYGGRKVCAIAQKQNVVGCQFHPEKSGPVGLKMLENFITKF